MWQLAGDECERSARKRKTIVRDSNVGRDGMNARTGVEGEVDNDRQR